MRHRLDLSLMLVTDARMCHPRTVVDLVERAVVGGVTVVQLRDKHPDRDRLRAEVQALRPLLRERGVPLILNDHVELARALEVDGVHLGQNDGSPVEARRVLGERAIIGWSVASLDEVATIRAEVVDYIGLGPIFWTSTKSDVGAPLGLDGLRRALLRIGLPVVGIGGVDRSNAADVVSAGADGVAVVSAICRARDPEQSARELIAVVGEARRTRR